LSPTLLSSFAAIELANPGSPGKMAVEVERERQCFGAVGSVAGKNLAQAVTKVEHLLRNFHWVT